MTKVVTTIVNTFAMLRKVYGKFFKKTNNEQHFLSFFSTKAGPIGKITDYQIMDEFMHIK